MKWLDLLFPPVCVGCGRWGRWMCRRCIHHIPWCEDPQNTLISPFPSLKRVWSVAEYDSLTGRFVQGLKYSRYRVLAKPLAEAMARQLSPALHRWKVEAFIPVPLHPRRYQERGFNQAGLLAQVCGKKLEIAVDWDILNRVKWHGTQASQNKHGRQEIQTMFRCTHRAQYQTVCLVDDVFTTGATLSACARALNQAGVKNVVAITFAKA